MLKESSKDIIRSHNAEMANRVADQVNHLLATEARFHESDQSKSCQPPKEQPHLNPKNQRVTDSLLLPFGIGVLTGCLLALSVHFFPSVFPFFKRGNSDV